jgi:hypothetical protein
MVYMDPNTSAKPPLRFYAIENIRKQIDSNRDVWHDLSPLFGLTGFVEGFSLAMEPRTSICHWGN